MLRKTLHILPILLLTFAACQSNEGETEVNDSDTLETRQADSMVLNDQQRSDSMMKALKEKMK